MSQKVVTVEQLKENARRSEALTMQVATAAAASIEDLSGEINSLKTSVSEGKSAIASAITGKGVSTSPTADFSTMAGNIGRIQTGVDTSDATATASDMLSGKTAYVKGAKVTGNILSQAGTTITPGTSQKIAVEAGRYTTDRVYVAGDNNLRPNNIRAGISIFGVDGTLTPIPMDEEDTDPNSPPGGNLTNGVLRIQIPDVTPPPAILIVYVDAIGRHIKSSVYFLNIYDECYYGDFINESSSDYVWAFGNVDYHIEPGSLFLYIDPLDMNPSLHHALCRLYS